GLLGLAAPGEGQGQGGDAAHPLQGVLLVDGGQHAVTVGVGRGRQQPAHLRQGGPAEAGALQGGEGAAAQLGGGGGQGGVRGGVGLPQDPGERLQGGGAVAVLVGQGEEALGVQLQVRGASAGAGPLRHRDRLAEQPAVVEPGGAVFAAE